MMQSQTRLCEPHVALQDNFMTKTISKGRSQKKRVKPIISKNNTKAALRFAKLHLKAGFLNNLPGREQTKEGRCLAMMHITVAGEDLKTEFEKEQNFTQ